LSDASPRRNSCAVSFSFESARSESTLRSALYFELMQARTYIFPKTGDDFASIAAREMPGVEGASEQLLSWNLHLAARAGLGRSVGLLPSDVVFTEPPLAKAASAVEPTK
jgi:hypothetical protein